jgi:hypothetical protein
VPVGPVANGWTRAAARCSRPSFSGGPVYLAQWVQDSRDRDLTCPALHGRREVVHPLTALLGSTYGPGQSGPAIATLQRGLHMRERYVTGRFDARTQRVLLAFQQLRALPPTGVATDLELTALGAGTVTPAVPSRIPRLFTPYPAP